MKRRYVRLKDRLSPQDLDDNGCISLVATVLGNAADEYRSVRRCRKTDSSKETEQHYELCRQFWLSDYFRRLTGGLISGTAILTSLDAEVI